MSACLCTSVPCRPPFRSLHEPIYSPPTGASHWLPLPASHSPPWTSHPASLVLPLFLPSHFPPPGGEMQPRTNSGRIAGQAPPCSVPQGGRRGVWGRGRTGRGCSGRKARYRRKGRRGARRVAVWEGGRVCVQGCISVSLSLSFSPSLPLHICLSVYLHVYIYM